MGRILRDAGFSERIEPQQWGEEWRERKHAQVIAPDGSILEITRADEYIRILALTLTKGPEPFAVYWLRSKDYPERPKTEFYLSKRMPAYMSSAGVDKIINRIRKGKARPWWTWTASRRSKKYAAVNASPRGSGSCARD